MTRIITGNIQTVVRRLKMDRVQHCSDCEFMKMYDYVYRNYYCDHEDRTDDMGKLGVDHPPKTSPKWCPKRKEGK